MINFSRILLILLPILYSANSYGAEAEERNRSQDEKTNSEISELSEMRSMLLEEDCKDKCKTNKDINSCVAECKINEHKKATGKKDYIITSGVKK